jgi:uncharacterized protein YbjT (DUF2867 family)
MASTKVAITGANSAVGLNLLQRLGERADIDVVASVRSERAAEVLPTGPRITTRIVPYEVDELSVALAGATCVVHLAGILVEWSGTSYATANVGTTLAVVEAARREDVEHVVFVSVVGADAGSGNRYFKSKGIAERAVTESGIPATILRTPILLGPGTAGAAALARTVEMGKAALLGGGAYTMRPLDLDDLGDALVRICDAPPDGVALLELVGPEPVTYRALVGRAAEVADRAVSMTSTPIWVAKVGAAIRRRLKGGGVSPTVIDVITKDEVVERNADAELGVTLTPLDETLRKILPQPERVK